MIDKSCMNWVGDDDCNICCIHGYIYRCPMPCKDYDGLFPHNNETKEGDE